MNTLERILNETAEELARRQARVPLSALENALSAGRVQRPFHEVLTRPGISLIAEFKRRAPGISSTRAGEVDVADVVTTFERGCAAAIAVVTEASTYGGSLEDLRSARAAVTLPLLCADFIIDSYQLHEAALYGADAVLLIAAVAQQDQLAELYREAIALELDVVVEISDQAGLEKALALDAEILSINNRDRSDYSLNLDRTCELLSDVPAGKTVVSQSGLSSRAQLDALERIGVDAALIGETLMGAADIELTCRTLCGVQAQGFEA